MKVYSYEGYQLLQKLNESIDEIIQNIGDNTIDAKEIKDLVTNQDKIFQKYDISNTELDNIKNGIEDSIRVKLGIKFEK